MKVLLLFLVVACLALLGCPSYSVHPLYTDQDAVVEPALEGAWVGPDPDDKEGVVFKKAGDHEYSMAVFYPATKVTQTYEVHLVRLRGHLFMDLIANDQTVDGAKLDGVMGVISTHIILKVKISGDDLAYATLELEDDALRKQNTAGGTPLDYYMVNEGVLVTASTDPLRRYISAHTEDGFSKFEHMKRKGKTPIQP
jgi:hypothetical protein